MRVAKACGSNDRKMPERLVMEIKLDDACAMMQTKFKDGVRRV